MRMNVVSRLLSLCAVALLPSFVLAEAPIDVGQPSSIVVEPAKFELLGKRSRQQLLITGVYAGDDVRDLTPAATFVSSNPAVVKVEGAVALPCGNGEATVTATVGALTYSVPVLVKNY